MGGKCVGGRNARGRCRAWYWEIPQWSIAGRRSGPLRLLYEGKNEILFLTGWGHPRPVQKAEFRKVYERWESYARGMIRTDYFMNDLHILNTPWIIPVLKHFERSMRDG